MKTHSQHILAEFHGCCQTKLNDIGFVETAMRAAAAESQATVMQSSFHQFGPQGVSGVLILAESHLSVHTWPEQEYAAMDIYTCGDTCMPERALDVLERALQATHCESMQIQRGLWPAGMRVVHSTTGIVGQ